MEENQRYKTHEFAHSKTQMDIMKLRNDRLNNFKIFAKSNRLNARLIVSFVKIIFKVQSSLKGTRHKFDKKGFSTVHNIFSSSSTPDIPSSYAQASRRSRIRNEKIETIDEIPVHRNGTSTAVLKRISSQTLQNIKGSQTQVKLRENKIANFEGSTQIRFEKDCYEA
jgi:hypothetical protein